MPLEIQDTMPRGWAHIDYWAGKLFWTQSLCTSILWVIKPNVLSFRKQLSPISSMQCPLAVSDGEEVTGFTVLRDHFWEPPWWPWVLSRKGNWAKQAGGAGGCPWGCTLHSVSAALPGKCLGWRRESLERRFPKQLDSFIWILLC